MFAGFRCSIMRHWMLGLDFVEVTLVREDYNTWVLMSDCFESCSEKEKFSEKLSLEGQSYFVLCGMCEGWYCALWILINTGFDCVV